MKIQAKTNAWGCKFAFVSALVLPLFIAVCGDAHVFDVASRDWDESAETGFLWDLRGCELELARVSSRCNQDDPDTLSARVGSDMEFPGEMVARLGRPCAGGPEVQVDIDVGARSIVYDFSNVEARGSFPNADFEGFVFTDVYHSVAAIREVSIDRTVSTMDVPDEAISCDAHGLWVNLAGMAFDSTSLIKIDIRFESDPE